MGPLERAAGAAGAGPETLRLAAAADAAGALPTLAAPSGRERYDTIQQTEGAPSGAEAAALATAGAAALRPVVPPDPEVRAELDELRDVLEALEPAHAATGRRPVDGRLGEARDHAAVVAYARAVGDVAGAVDGVAGSALWIAAGSLAEAGAQEPVPACRATEHLYDLAAGLSPLAVAAALRRGLELAGAPAPPAAPSGRVLADARTRLPPELAARHERLDRTVAELEDVTAWARRATGHMDARNDQVVVEDLRESIARQRAALADAHLQRLDAAEAGPSRLARKAAQVLGSLVPAAEAPRGTDPADGARATRSLAQLVVVLADAAL